MLGDRSLQDPGRPPYYSEHFFSTIRKVKDKTHLNVTYITSKHWYEIILREGVTHTRQDEQTPPVIIRTRSELLHPTADHEVSSRLSRLRGLTPDQKAFLFKVKNDLLPTKERLFRINKVPSPSCSLCNDLDGMDHFISCDHGSAVMVLLLRCLAKYMPTITPTKVALLQFEMPKSLELPLVWITVITLEYVWERRQVNRPVSPAFLQGELWGRHCLLRGLRRHLNTWTLLKEIIENNF
jgi:hypothetical protein